MGRILIQRLKKLGRAFKVEKKVLPICGRQWAFGFRKGTIGLQSWKVYKLGWGHILRFLNIKTKSLNFLHS